MAMRETIRSEAPQLREAVRWSNPFWMGNTAVFCLQCFPDHVNLGLLRGAELVAEFPQLEGTGKGMRHVRLDQETLTRSPAVRRLIRAAVRLDASS